MTKIDCSKPIVPAVSIGNIQQGGYLSDFINSIDDINLLSLPKMIAREYADALVEYDYNHCIKIIADVTTDSILNIIAYNSYSGSINNQICIGMAIGELLMIDNSFECCAGGLMSMNFLGICIYFTENFDADAHDLTPYLDNKILGIGLIRQFNKDGLDNYICLYGEKYFDRYNK